MLHSILIPPDSLDFLNGATPRARAHTHTHSLPERSNPPLYVVTQKASLIFSNKHVQHCASDTTLCLKFSRVIKIFS